MGLRRRRRHGGALTIKWIVKKDSSSALPAVRLSRYLGRLSLCRSLPPSVFDCGINTPSLPPSPPYFLFIQRAPRSPDQPNHHHHHPPTPFSSGRSGRTNHAAAAAVRAICPSKYRESKLETLLEQITALARLAGDYAAAVYVFLSDRRNAERKGTGCGS